MSVSFAHMSEHTQSCGSIQEVQIAGTCEPGTECIDELWHSLSYTNFLWILKGSCGRSWIQSCFETSSEIISLPFTTQDDNVNT